MRSHSLPRSFVVLLGLTCGGVSALAAGPGGAPRVEALIPISVQEREEISFWGQWQVAERGYTWHRISIQPSFEYRAFYTDNIFTFQQGTPKADLMHYVSPQLLLTREFYPGEWDVVVSAGYTPTFVVHTFNGQFDRTYHLARAGINGRRNEQVFSLDHTYYKGSEFTSELGFLVPQESHQTQLSYAMPLSGKLSLAASAGQQLIDSSLTQATTGRSLKSWRGDGFVLYDWLPKTTTGLGLGMHYQEQTGLQGNYQSLFESILTRWHYVATGKIQLSLDAGVQIGQSLTRGGDDFSPTPIGRLDVQYSPRYGTFLSLSAARTSGLSALQSAQTATENRVDLSVRQRVYQTMSVSITAGYGQGSYGNTLTATGISIRSYDTYTGGVQYTWEINSHVRLTGFYQYIRRQSNLAFDSYSNNQVGFVVNVAL